MVMMLFVAALCGDEAQWRDMEWPGLHRAPGIRVSEAWLMHRGDVNAGLQSNVTNAKFSEFKVGLFWTFIEADL